VGSQRDWHNDRRFCIFIANTIGGEGLSIVVRRHLYPSLSITCWHLIIFWGAEEVSNVCDKYHTQPERSASFNPLASRFSAFPVSADFEYSVCAESKISLNNYECRKAKALVYLSAGFEYTGSQQRPIFHDISGY